MPLRLRSFARLLLGAWRSVSKRNNSGGLVYSTAVGRTCPGCRRAIDQCSCNKHKAKPVSDGIVRVSRQIAGRNGKSVTVIKGLALNAVELVDLAKQLKTACGSGGTVKDGVIEVQGDHCDRVIATLTAKGYKTKRAGG
jgi:translation initiation factor 1